METQISIGQSMCLRDNLVQLVGRARALIERIPLVPFQLIVIAHAYTGRAYTIVFFCS